MSVNHAYRPNELPEGEAGPSFRFPVLAGATRVLLLVNAGLFLAGFVLYLVAEGAQAKLYQIFALDPQSWMDWAPAVPLWQLLSYSFLHSVSDLWHVVMNMLMLFFAGSALEGLIGTRRFLWTYLSAAFVGGLCFLCLGLLGWGGGYVVGASGAVFGVLIALAVLRPEARVFLFPLPIPISLRVLAWILVASQLALAALAWKQGGDGTAYSAHLGGMATGFALAQSGWLWRDPMQSWREKRAAAQLAAVQGDEERLDELLARISRSGIGTLSERERDFLKRMSKRRQA